MMSRFFSLVGDRLFAGSRDQIMKSNARLMARLGQLEQSLSETHYQVCVLSEAVAEQHALIEAKIDAQSSYMKETKAALLAEASRVRQEILDQQLRNTKHLDRKMAAVHREVLESYKRLKAAGPDIRVTLQRRATEQSADYVLKHMRDVQSVHHKMLCIDAAVENVKIENGLALEFGVYSGETVNHIASQRTWTVHGFDSFEGLPETWRDGFMRGHFARDALPEVADNVKLHVGWFHDALPAFKAGLEDPKQPISLLHVDCDLYSSTKTILTVLEENIVPGTIIIFDEYFNFDGWQEGEFLAFQEFIAASKFGYRYLTYNFRHEQVVVEILASKNEEATV